MNKIKFYLLVQQSFKAENKMSKGLRTGLSTALSTKLSTRLSTRPSNCCVQSRAFGAVSQIHRVANCTLFHLSSFSSFSSCSPTTIPPISPYFSPLLPLFFSNSLHTFPYILPVHFSPLVSLSLESPLVWHFSRLRGRESATPP